MAMAEHFPTDPRLQPIAIGTAEIAFAGQGPEWDDFVRGRRGLVGISLELAPDDIANEFLASMKYRVVSLASRTLAETRRRYQIIGYDARRASALVTLDFSVIPADITLILGTSATLLYKSLKDYKTIRENVILVYDDLSVGLNAIAERLASLYKSFERMEFVRKMQELIKAIGMAAIYEEYRDDPTLHDPIAFEKKMKEEQQALDERLRQAQAEGRLGGGDKIVVKKSQPKD
jgi:hypothetical protein